MPGDLYYLFIEPAERLRITMLDAVLLKIGQIVAFVGVSLARCGELRLLQPPTVGE